MIILYSTGCPKCKVLEKKLERAGIQYTVNNDVKEMLNKGIDTVPYLQVDNNLLNFNAAREWVDQYGN